MKLLSLNFLKAYFVTMRPYLTFVSGIAGLAGISFIANPSMLKVSLAFVCLFSAYGFGQALTDCFQVDTDSLSSPYRPLVQGIVSRRQVLGVSLAGLVGGALSMAILNPKILIFACLAILGLVSYTSFKRWWWGGPPCDSLVVALLPIMGRLIEREQRIAEFFNLKSSDSLAFVFAVLAVFFGYANFVVIGYFKDISADRKTGYQTFPVVFGWQPAAIYSDITALFTALLTAAVLLLKGVTIAAAAIFMLAFFLNLWAQIKIHLIKEERRTFGPICNVLRSFILYNSAIVATLKPGWIVFIFLYYIFFELALKLRPEESQV